MKNKRFTDKIPQVRVTAEMKEEVERIATRWHLKTADVVRLALAEFILWDRQRVEERQEGD